MHRIPSLALCITLVWTLLAVVPAQAQPGWVLSHQEISSTEGGFTGVVEGGDEFGWSVASLGDLDGDDVGNMLLGVTWVISFSTVQPANAGVITNGGFETGDFTGWEVLPASAAEVRESLQGVEPTEGDYLAFMRTAQTGLPSDSTIEDFLALPIGTLDALSTGDARFGSAFRQVLDIEAGDALAFDWDFLTQSSFPGGNDFAFVAIDGVATLLADFSADFGPTPGGFVHTGFSTFEHEFPTAGSVILGFGVMDVDSGIHPSFVLVDRVILESTAPVSFRLDVKPGSCPNPFNRHGNGVLPVALVGTVEFDPTEVDLSTLQLSRADGVGGSVAPNEGPPGPHSVFEDVATPFDGEGCECHDLGGDGIDDLSMKFKTHDLVDALELDELPGGAVVELVLSGSLLDGTPFVASDCVVIVPPGDLGPINATVGSNVGDTFIELTPLDLNIDSDGFSNFGRAYYPGTLLTVTAPPTSEGRRFVRWMVDGVLQEIGVRTIEVAVAEDTTLQALYRGQRRLRPDRPTESDAPLD